MTKLGNNFALLIGVEDYESFPPLKSPLSDVNALAGILKKKFSFNVKVLEKPNRTEMMKSINAYNNLLKAGDSFILYFAGHGEEEEDQGFWIPQNGDREDDTEWISNDYIIRKLKNLKATNILVIADSCFSGLLITKGVKFKKNDSAIDLSIFQKTKTRAVITSGGVEPVLDSGSGENSLFAESLIKYLRKSKEPFTALELYHTLRSEVVESSYNLGHKQTPEWGQLPNSKHEGPDFVFIPN